jgi:hypothetical protein
MSPEVKCKVDTCSHWKQGELCSADKIEISVGMQSRSSFKTEMAEELTQKSTRKAETSENTLCHTFKPKSS